MLHLLFKPSFTATNPLCYCMHTVHHLFTFPSNRILPGSFHMPLAFSPYSTGLCIMNCSRNSLQQIHVCLIETSVNSLLKCVCSHFQPMVSFGGNVLFCLPFSIKNSVHSTENIVQVLYISLHMKAATPSVIFRVQKQLGSNFRTNAFSSAS